MDRYKITSLFGGFISRIAARSNRTIRFEHFDNVPTEVIAITIFSFLDGVDLRNTALVSKAWNRFSENPMLWRDLCYQRFASEELARIDVEDLLLHRGWKWLYRAKTTTKVPTTSHKNPSFYNNNNNKRKKFKCGTHVFTDDHPQKGIISRTYSGDWENNQPHGYGLWLIEWKSNRNGRYSTFQGFSNQGKMGKGIYVFSTGDKFVGEMNPKDGTIMHGTLLYAKSGNRYTGTFSNSMIQGEGVLEFSTGGRYVGHFKDGVRHGYGVDTAPNNSQVIEGYFANGKPNGWCISTTYRRVSNNQNNQNNQNTNALVNQADEGGRKRSASSSSSASSAALVVNTRYEGDMVDGKFEGWGTYLFGDIKSRIHYMGQWKDGKPCGRGTLVYTKLKQRYEGQVQNWKPNGTGTMHFANGYSWHGEWKDGKKVSGTLSKTTTKTTTTTTAAAAATTTTATATTTT